VTADDSKGADAVSKVGRLAGENRPLGDHETTTTTQATSKGKERWPFIFATRGNFAPNVLLVDVLLVLGRYSETNCRGRPE